MKTVTFTMTTENAQKLEALQKQFPSMTENELIEMLLKQGREELETPAGKIHAQADAIRCKLPKNKTDLTAYEAFCLATQLKERDYAGIIEVITDLYAAGYSAGYRAAVRRQKAEGDKA